MEIARPPAGQYFYIRPEGGGCASGDKCLPKRKVVFPDPAPAFRLTDRNTVRCGTKEKSFAVPLLFHAADDKIKKMKSIRKEAKT